MPVIGEHSLNRSAVESSEAPCRVNRVVSSVKLFRALEAFERSSSPQLFLYFSLDMVAEDAETLECCAGVVTVF
jgi:hypothetical protein